MANAKEALEELFGKIDIKNVLSERIQEEIKYGGAFIPIEMVGPKPCTTMVVYDEEFAMKQFVRQLKARARKTARNAISSGQETTKPPVILEIV